MSGQDDEDPFGAMNVAELELDDVDSKIDKRERRFREAFQYALQTYSAKEDSDGWFLDDRNLTNGDPTMAEEAIVYHYYKREYTTALEWALRVLRELNVLGEAPRDWKMSDSLPLCSSPRDPSTFPAAARELIDITLLCIMHGAHCSDSDVAVLFAEALLRIRPPSSSVFSVDMGLAAARAQVWTSNPGLAYTLGDACMYISRPKCALEAYALAFGARGPQWRAMRSASDAFFQLGKLRFALAAAGCALQLCPEKHKSALVAHVRATGVVGEIQPKPISGSLPKISDNLDTATRYCREMSEFLSLPAAVAMTYCGLQRRGGIDVLCMRIPYYLAGDSDAHDDDIEAPRSVQSL